MKKKLTFGLTTIWILFSRSYDAYATYQYTPDLSHEANPLVSIGGLGWLPLLSIIGFLSLLVIYAYYLTVFKPHNLHPTEKDYSFSEFAGFVYTGKKQPWYISLLKIPTSFKRFVYYTGHLLTLCLSFAGVVSTIMWLLINYVPAYMKIHTATLIYSIILVGCFIIHYYWFKLEFKKYKASSKFAVNIRP